MGNTLIQDSKTGHIMGLSEGFVPVGLKEHGGIMYVVSANKDGVGEIGTIPSPVLKLELRKGELSQNKMQVTTKAGPVSTMVGITDFKVYPGEKFLPALDLTYDTSGAPTTFEIQNIDSHQLPKTIIPLQQRFISTITEGVGCSHNGLYELKLFSIYGSSATELSHVQKKQARPYLKVSNSLANNPFWFYQGKLNNTQVDIEKTWLNKGFHTYPGNLPPGKLAIKAELEQIDYFGLPTISQSSQSKQKETKAPYITKQRDDYYLCFPGFEYKTRSIRFIGELEITLTNQSSGKIIPIGIINQFSTVNVGETDTQYYYQIQNKRTTTYKKIEPEDTPQDDLAQYFTPLFIVDIGKELNAWYRLEVKYKDIYEGYIDTFVYSFNPYHILNFDESYQNVQWQSRPHIQQWQAISNPDQIINGGQIKSISPDTYYDEGSSITWVFSGQSNESIKYTKYLDDTYCTVELSSSDFQESRSGSSVKTVQMNPVYTKYLYTKAPTDEKTQSDYTYEFYSACPAQMITCSGAPLAVEALSNQFDPLSYNDAQNKWSSKFWSPDYKASIIFPFDEDSVTININQSISDLPNTLYTFRVSGVEPGQRYTDTINVYNTFGKKTDGGQDIFYEDNTNKTNSTKLVLQYTMPNLSPYSLVPSFSLFGDTDEKLKLRLGLDREGRPKEAWAFGQNLYQTCMPDKSITLTSSFEKNAKYYALGIEGTNGQTADGVGSNLVLDAGVYLITVDAGVPNACGKFYAKNGNVIQGKVDVYGCNTNWENSDFSPTTSKNEDPRIAVVIQNTYYQIARVDSMINETRRRTFMPTLLYLPKQSIIRMEWKYVQKLQGIGIFRVTKPVVFNNGDWFDEGNDIRIMYYQHPDLREIILPLEATYQESASCLDKEYAYYPGMQSLSSINHHINMNAIDVKFCKAPERKGTWNYNDTDPTYIWDSEGKGLMEFVYQYWQDNPLQSTEIPMIAGNNNRLEYRKLNSTT